MHLVWTGDLIPNVKKALSEITGLDVFWNKGVGF